jgi:uncharacterized NAD-dependent epimerase/dehydratase family protein
MVNTFPEGNALVYCEKAFTTTYGKTAHGLVRRTERYHVLAVIDSDLSGEDAGTALDGSFRGIPVCGNIQSCVEAFRLCDTPATHFVIGLAPDGGRLDRATHAHVKEAIGLGLHIDSGLHDFLSEDPELSGLAAERKVVIRDIRKPPSRKELHFFTGKIEEVNALKVAVLGTDSAIGKRTTAWVLLDALQGAGLKAELVGTGQTCWMQGAQYGIILDSLINDFVSGEIEHAVWTAWKEVNPDVILIEGQGSLMNPAYPGGFEILAAGRPDLVVLQHAPARTEYDGFPGYPLHSIDKQIEVIELLSGKPVVAITINHEKLQRRDVADACARISKETGLPVFDVLVQGATQLVNVLHGHMKS